MWLFEEGRFAERPLQPGLPASFLMLDTLRSPVASLASDMAICKTVAWLKEQLELGNERLLLMDCRPQELYESSHIESAINVALPGIMLRRLQKGNLPLRALFARGEEEREKFARRCGTDTVVLYDENSSDWNENAVGDSVLGLLLKRLKGDGCKAFYLEGEGLKQVGSAVPGSPALFCLLHPDPRRLPPPPFRFALIPLAPASGICPPGALALPGPKRRAARWPWSC